MSPRENAAAQGMKIHEHISRTAAPLSTMPRCRRFASSSRFRACWPGRGPRLPWISASPISNRSAIAIRFVDDGNGIAAEDLARIFEPFCTTKRAQGGSGLGLHIVYDLIRVKLGGQIEAHGEPGPDAL